jgi:hypothetical protein
MTLRRCALGRDVMHSFAPCGRPIVTTAGAPAGGTHSTERASRPLKRRYMVRDESATVEGSDGLRAYPDPGAFLRACLARSQTCRLTTSCVRSMLVE